VLEEAGGGVGCGDCAGCAFGELEGVCEGCEDGGCFKGVGC
jgi:hypothetical protein